MNCCRMSTLKDQIVKSINTKDNTYYHLYIILDIINTKMSIYEKHDLIKFFIEETLNKDDYLFRDQIMDYYRLLDKSLLKFIIVKYCKYMKDTDILTVIHYIKEETDLSVISYTTIWMKSFYFDKFETYKYLTVKLFKSHEILKNLCKYFEEEIGTSSSLYTKYLNYSYEYHCKNDVRNYELSNDNDDTVDSDISSNEDLITDLDKIKNELTMLENNVSSSKFEMKIKHIDMNLTENRTIDDKKTDKKSNSSDIINKNDRFDKKIEEDILKSSSNTSSINTKLSNREYRKNRHLYKFLCYLVIPLSQSKRGYILSNIELAKRIIKENQNILEIYADDTINNCFNTNVYIALKSIEAKK